MENIKQLYEKVKGVGVAFGSDPLNLMNMQSKKE